MNTRPPTARIKSELPNLFVMPGKNPPEKD
jgi:hypothetical protein